MESTAHLFPATTKGLTVCVGPTIAVFLILENPDEATEFLLEAYHHGMMNGENAFITVDFLVTHGFVDLQTKLQNSCVVLEFFASIVPVLQARIPCTDWLH